MRSLFITPTATSILYHTWKNYKINIEVKFEVPDLPFSLVASPLVAYITKIGEAKTRNVAEDYINFIARTTVSRAAADDCTPVYHDRKLGQSQMRLL